MSKRIAWYLLEDGKAGKQYRIPAAWVQGYLYGHRGATVYEALDHWLEQARLEEHLSCPSE